MKKMLSVVLTCTCIDTRSRSFGNAEAPARVNHWEQPGIFRIFEYDAYKKAQEDLNIKIDFTYYPEDSFSAMLAGGDMADIMVVAKPSTKPRS